MRKSIPTIFSRAAVVALTATLAACGGGEPSSSATDGKLAFVQQMSAASSAQAPMRALAATGVVNAETVLDWLEFKFPDLLPKAVSSGSLPFESDGVRFTIRAYTHAGGVRYVGITTQGEVYGLGDFTGNQLQGYGNFSAIAAQVRADECSVYPARCGAGGASNEPVGPLNACAMSAQQILVPGNRLNTVYASTGYETGQYTITQVVEGPATFENKAAIRVNSTTTGTATVDGDSAPINVSGKSYQVARADGFTSTLGSEVQVVSRGFSLTTKAIFSPADINSEFSLSVGQSFTKPTSSTSTTTPIGGTTSGTLSMTYVFEGLETITVRGKTYSTCRYKMTGPFDVTKSWYIQGKGIAARSEETRTQGTTVQTTVRELVSGDINGQPL